MSPLHSSSSSSSSSSSKLPLLSDNLPPTSPQSPSSSLPLSPPSLLSQPSSSSGPPPPPYSYYTFNPTSAFTNNDNNTSSSHLVHHSVITLPTTTNATINTSSHLQYHHHHHHRSEYLRKRTPCSDCSRAALCPMLTFILVVVALCILMFCYPRLLSVHINSVALDTTKFPPLKLSLDPQPSLTFHLVGNVSIYNPLFSDLHNVSVLVTAMYPHFDPPITIGHTTLDHVLELPSNTQALERIPFDLHLPGTLGLPTRGKSLSPSLLDVVLALMDDCNSRGRISLDLEVRTKATTSWWHFGGSTTILHNQSVACSSDSTGTTAATITSNNSLLNSTNVSSVS